MSDISFCNGLKELQTCPMRRKCSRYIYSTDPNKHSMWQSHIETPDFKVLENGDVECEMYLKYEK